MSLNAEKEQDRLTSLKIIEKRYSFLFEDVWFILVQYMYFEKFIVRNAVYLERFHFKRLNIQGIDPVPLSQ